MFEHYYFGHSTCKSSFKLQCDVEDDGFRYTRASSYLFNGQKGGGSHANL